MKRWLAILAIVIITGSMSTAIVSAGAPAGSEGYLAHSGQTPDDGAEFLSAGPSRVARSSSLLEAMLEQADVSERHPLFVMGPDDRVRVTPADPRFPYIQSWFDINYNGVTDNGEIFGCSSSLIGARVLLTAAHCLYSQDYEFAAEVAVVPGLDGISVPYGAALAYDYYVPVGWAESGDHIYDYGLVILSADDRFGDAFGRLPLGVLSDASLHSPDLWAITIGYPSDKPSQTQWITSVPSLNYVGPDTFTSDLDQYHGQSGSSILRKADSAIFGVVSHGTVASGIEVNVSRRVTQDVIDFALSACADVGCSFDYFFEQESPTPTATPTPPPPQPTPTATATAPPSPQPTPTATPSPTATPPPTLGDTSAFQRTWERTDRVVSEGIVSRTWLWGPPFTGVMTEPYVEGSGGVRGVQYYDKSRMEITDPAGDPNSPWYVTNGLLATELVSGKLQLGDNTFEQHQPAQVNAAGDPDDATGPTYATFGTLLEAAPNTIGAGIVQRVDRNGTVTADPALASQGVSAAQLVPETNHTVASVFWTFMNSEGAVYENGVLTTNKLFENPFYATGFPITEPYWASVKVGGVYKDVLIQVFQRRVLTYTPGNPAGFQVEAGNVGRHYFHWRYELIPTEQQ